MLGCGVLLSSLLIVGSACGADAAKQSAPKKPSPDVAEGANPPYVNPPYYDVFGKRYRVRTSSNGYRERGTASWYGRPFDGHPTTSGEMYNMHAMTAAHPTLPIPTWVEVTNLANGKRVTVKVNDRGPFVGKRLIDVSYAAATKLDMVRNGTAEVEVRALPGPPRGTTDRPSKPERGSTSAREGGKATEPVAAAPAAPAPTPAPAKSRPDSARPAERPPTPPAESERLFAEAGKFKNRDDAVQLVEDLKRQGFPNAFVVTEDNRRRSLHRVRVGPLADAAAVEEMNDRLRDLGARHRHSVAMN